MLCDWIRNYSARATAIAVWRYAIVFASVSLLAGSSSLVAADAGRGTRQADAANAESEVRRLNAEEVQAFLQRNPKTLARLWSDEFVVTNPLNRFVTKSQVLGMIDSGFLVITSFEREIEYLKVYDGTVIVAGRETVCWGGGMPNAGRTEHLRFTAVWMKDGDRWDQVARHANIVPEIQESAKPTATN